MNKFYIYLVIAMFLGLLLFTETYETTWTIIKNRQFNHQYN